MWFADLYRRRHPGYAIGHAITTDPMSRLNGTQTFFFFHHHTKKKRLVYYTHRFSLWPEKRREYRRDLTRPRREHT